MVPKETKRSKQAAFGTRDITLIIPETNEIIRKLGNATSQCVIMAAYKIGLLAMYGIKKHKEKITCNSSVQVLFNKWNT